MFSHDQEYLSGMATVALAVLSLIVMCCIRAAMPDEAAISSQPAQQVAADIASQSSVHTAMNDGEATPQHR